jgi:hypothetical protein
MLLLENNNVAVQFMFQLEFVGGRFRAPSQFTGLLQPAIHHIVTTSSRGPERHGSKVHHSEQDNSNDNTQNKRHQLCRQSGIVFHARWQGLKSSLDQRQKLQALVVEKSNVSKDGGSESVVIGENPMYVSRDWK